MVILVGCRPLIAVVLNSNTTTLIVMENVIVGLRSHHEYTQDNNQLSQVSECCYQFWQDICTSKSGIEESLDRFAAWYIPFILIAALVTALIPALLSRGRGMGTQASPCIF